MTPGRGFRLVPPETSGRSDFPHVPWGIGGTVIGLLAVLFLWIIAGFVTALLLRGPPEEASVGARYGMMIALQAVLVVVPIVIAVVNSAGPESLGLRPYSFRALFEGALVGVLLVVLGSAYAWGLGAFWPQAYAKMAAEQAAQMKLLAGSVPLLLLVAVVVAPLGEEIFFRGFVFGGLRSRLGFAWASGLSAALFAGIHLMPWSLVPLFAVGLGTAVVYERHRSLAACMMAHAAYNLVSLALEAIS